MDSGMQCTDAHEVGGFRYSWNIDVISDITHVISLSVIIDF